ncbi:hypothetical protein SARC_07259 [Sphaeroforma arctica JP610]|uniref:Glycoside-hydrolase family GH114 TIM-barrel domain-containing protein n=1 Tax=Sphaeroforma arctica JP610 TaxID=667725 RepID=A0A0L0FUP1_9EUKA|nr:hypothetical protein SARC_07259 [Sphaeroforma arctica JP610]KNC80384.1 hypothetical protein SARC_07259 [Sphaeroforma arctica JP610]|eukprot:XP_014154286.1 hypothetical protein SARC_07259 [Sphaeroforma arctica JP610]
MQTSTVELVLNADLNEDKEHVLWYKSKKFLIGVCVVATACVATGISLAVISANNTAHETHRAEVRASMSTPVAGTSWTLEAWGYKDEVKDDNYMVVVDMFDTSKSTIEKYQDEGHFVICYISAGTLESWRPDANTFPDSVLGLAMEDWAGEKWFDISKIFELEELMEPRFQMARDKGCQGIENDNVDCFINKCVSGMDKVDLTGYQLNYNKWLADTAHKYGMISSLKNAGDLVYQLVDWFDMVIVEECANYNECGLYKPFTQQNKGIFSVEYKTSSTAAKCSEAKEEFIRRKWNSDSTWKDCDY